MLNTNADKEYIYNKISQLVEQNHDRIKYLILLAHCVLLGVDNLAEREKLANELGNNIVVKLQYKIKINKNFKKILQKSFIAGIKQKIDDEQFIKNLKKILIFLSKRKQQNLLKVFSELCNEICLLCERKEKNNISSSPQFARALSNSFKKNEKEVFDFFAQEIGSSPASYPLPSLLKKSNHWKKIKNWVDEENKNQTKLLKQKHARAYISHWNNMFVAVIFLGLGIAEFDLFKYINNFIGKIFNISNSLELFVATLLLVAIPSAILIITAVGLITYANTTHTLTNNYQGEIKELQDEIALLLNDAFKLQVIEEVQVPNQQENSFAITFNPNADFNENQASVADNLSYFNLYKYLPSKAIKRGKGATLSLKEEKNSNDKRDVAPIELAEINESATHITRIIKSSNNQKIKVVLLKNVLERIPDKSERFAQAFKEAHFGKIGTCFKPLAIETGNKQFELKIKGSKYRLWGTEQCVEFKTANGVAENENVILFNKYGKGLH